MALVGGMFLTTSMSKTEPAHLSRALSIMPALLYTFTGKYVDEFCAFSSGNTQAEHRAWLETALWEAERKRGNMEVREGLTALPRSNQPNE